VKKARSGSASKRWGTATLGLVTIFTLLLQQQEIFSVELYCYQRASVVDPAFFVNRDPDPPQIQGFDDQK
jgi:hypothetical protein